MTTEEMLLQLIEGQKRTDERLDKMSTDISNLKEGQKQMVERLDKIENDLDEIKEDVTAAKITASHNGNILEKLTDQLSTLNIVDVKYY